MNPFTLYEEEEPMPPLTRNERLIAWCIPAAVFVFWGVVGYWAYPYFTGSTT